MGILWNWNQQVQGSFFKLALIQISTVSRLMFVLALIQRIGLPVDEVVKKMEHFVEIMLILEF